LDGNYCFLLWLIGWLTGQGQVDPQLDPSEMSLMEFEFKLKTL